MLLSVRPAIFIEVGSEVAESVAQLLRKSAYRLFDGASLTELSKGEPVSWDTVAVPEEGDFRGALNYGV